MWAARGDRACAAAPRSHPRAGAPLWRGPGQRADAAIRRLGHDDQPRPGVAGQGRALAKVHGGATRVGPATEEPVRLEVGPTAAEKSAIAARGAAQLVTPGVAVAVAGTTTAELAHRLAGVSGGLTVVTNSIPVAEVFHRGGSAGPDGGAHRRGAYPVRRPGRPGGGGGDPVAAPRPALPRRARR